MSDDRQWQPGGGGLGELDDRTVPRRRARASTAFTLRVDDGSEHIVTGRTFVGRMPEPQPIRLGGSIVRIDDTTMSVSKTHLLVDVVDDSLRVSDVGSTNGTIVQSSQGDAPVPSGGWSHVAVGDRLRLGDRWIDVLGPEGTPLAPDFAGIGSDRHAPSASAASDPRPHLQPMPTPPGAGAIRTVPPSEPVAEPNAATPLTPDMAPQRRRDLKCSNCKTKLGAAVQFCTECGTPVPPGGLSGKSGNRRLAVTAVTAVAVVAALVAGVLVVFDRGDDSVAASAAFTLRADPESRFRTDVERLPNGFVTLVGATDRSYVVSSGYDSGSDVETLVVALDGEGDTVWEERFDGEAYSAVPLDDDLLIGMFEEDESTLLRIDGSNGDEVWSDSHDQRGSFISGDRLFLVEQRSDGHRLERLDPETGESLGRMRLLGSRSPSADLRTSGVFISWDREDEEAQVFSPLFEEMTETIEVGEATAMAYQDGVLLVAEDDDLIGYDSVGDEQFSDSSPIDVTSSIQPLGGDRWLVSGSDEVEAIRIVDGRVEDIWSEDGTLGDLAVVGGRSYVVVYDDGDRLLLDGETGDEIERSEGRHQFGSNGFVVTDYDGDAEAFGLPDGESMWRERFDSAEQGFWMLTDGYGLVEPDDDEARIEVFR